MATMPDETDVGGQIARAGRSTVYNRGPELEANAIGRGAEQLNQSVQAFAVDFDNFNLARARSALQQANAATQKQLENDPEWHTQEKRYETSMKEAREAAGKMIVSPRARALFDMDAEASITRGTEVIRENARRAEGQWGRSTLDETLAANRVAALETKDEATRSALVKSTQEAINGALVKQYITPEQATQVRQAWTAQYGEGFVEMQPDAEQVKMLKNPKGTPADFIDPAKRAQMLERLEYKAEIATNKREAKAERALAQAERQISSGVPATPEMWREWGATIAGTSVAGDFNGLVAGEKEVQATLRKPIGEQIRLVQDKRAALMKNGGSVADAANITRLETAVKQNVALLQTSPLLFAEQRMNTPTTPLNVTDVVDPEKRSETAATFQDRAANIRTLSKQFGAPVPMRPLLEQESAQLSQYMGTASPKEAAELFLNLRESAGSPDVYRGMMNQVAPDQPVMAMAGLLAAKQRDLVTDSNWFAADVTVASRDVAATLIQGERLLNPNKTDKASDGKPQTKSIYLPDPDALQMEFADEVGTAFIGRPDAANNALQAVRAYYVGRAAQTGRVAGDETDVDTDLVKEAVRNTLGTVVDYNGQGEVLAPWGMSEDDFEDRVAVAIDARAKDLKLEILVPGFQSESHAFGLTNASGDGIYAVTLGNKPVYDGNGELVLINIKPRDARDAKGYINRSPK